MKRVRTTNGVSRIDDTVPSSARTAEMLSEILQAHRETLIRRLLNGMDAYLLYRFNAKLTTQEKEPIKDRLNTLKNSAIDREKYSTFFREIDSHENLYVGTTKFYEEIDEAIRWQLQEEQIVR
jgi:hypothetical protein